MGASKTQRRSKWKLWGLTKFAMHLEVDGRALCGAAVPDTRRTPQHLRVDCRRCRNTKVWRLHDQRQWEARRRREEHLASLRRDLLNAALDDDAEKLAEARRLYLEGRRLTIDDFLKLPSRP